MRMHKVARVFLSSFLLFFLSGLLTPSVMPAQELTEEAAGESTEEKTENPEETLSPEASAYLLNLKLGDSDVNLMWDGYWRMSFVTGGSFGKQTAETAFPGLARGTAFFQEPDVTITLWINDRWFLETTFLEGFERNTYRAGYVGREDEFVQEVTLGNAGVNATSYAEIDVPAPRYNTPGIVAKFATEKSEHELLVRYDPTEADSMLFQGEYEVKTQDLGLPDFVEGKYFILPDKAVTDVAVYLEDRLGSISGTDGLGTIRKYRLAESAEYYVDSSSGLVVLSEPHQGQVVAFYNTAFGAVGAAGGGASFIVPPDANRHPDLSKPLLNFEWGLDDAYAPQGSRTYLETSSVDIAGHRALILYNPGRFTPFERQNVYLSSWPLPEETWRIVPLIKDRGALYPGTAPEFGFIPDIIDKSISVYGAVGSEDGLRSPANRYPFASADPEVYGPGRETDMNKLSRIIVLAIREPNPGYNLGTGIVPGSVIVRVNGVRDKTVEISDDGSLTFTRFIYLDDWIEVSYRTEVLDMEGGDLFVYQGNHFQLGPRLNLELAESVRWNISQDRTVDEYKKSPGEIKVASTLDWQADMAALRLTGDVSLTTPDTAGNLRLFGMDKGGMGLVFLDSTLVKSPDDIPGYTFSNRQPSDRYNYISNDGVGREILNDYLWPGAESTQEDGPALAARRNGDPTDGRVMDLRFNDAAGEWNAGDFLGDFNGPINLSGYTAMEFPVKFLDVGGTAPRFILQAGEIGESEDHHEDGAVDAADPGSMVEWDISSELGTAWDNEGSWATVRLTLTPTERARLGNVRAFRLIIDNETASSPVSGRIILGAPQFEGSPFRSEIRDPDDTLVSAQDIAGDEITDNSLKTAFPEVAELFHPGGEPNMALRIRWGADVPGGVPLGTASGTDDRWEAVSWFSAVPLEAYRTMVFYVRDNGPSGEMTARATDENGSGVKVSWTSAVTGWDRITVNISDGTASSARGNTIDSVTVDRDSGVLTRFVLIGADFYNDASGALNSGTVYLDEIHFRDPAFALTGGAELQGNWRYEEDVVSIGDFPVLGDISVEGRTVLAGGKILSGIDSGNTAVTGSITAGADILGVKLKTDWRGTWGLGVENWSGSHDIRIPARSTTFWISDTYARGVTGDLVSFSRKDEVNLNFSPGSIRIFGASLYDGVSLIQSWGGDTSWKGKNWSTKLEVFYILNSEDTPESSGDYFSSWIKDFSLLMPSDGAIINREAHHTFNGKIGSGPLTLEWDPQLRMKSGRAPVWNQENRWAGTLSLPLRFERWSIIPSYRRDLTQVINTSAQGNNSYSEVWNTFFSGVSGQLPLFTYVPFRELFSDEDGKKFTRVTEGMSEAKYETEAGISLNRTSGSRILDLFLPSTGDFSMERRYNRKGDTTGWENEWRGSLGFSAINLFGQFGRFPLIPFYNTEEISSLIQITLEDFNGVPVPDPQEVLWQVNWSFTGTGNNKLVLDNRLSWNWDPEMRETKQEGRIEYQWRTATKEALHIPLINRAIPRQHHMESKERLIITGLFPWQDAPPESYMDIGFTIYHETSWVFQDSGHLRGWLALGLGERDEVFTNGWEMGIEAEFRF